MNELLGLAVLIALVPLSILSMLFSVAFISAIAIGAVAIANKFFHFLD